LSPASFRSSVMDSLLRLADMKYVDSRSSPSPRNGGPQPRLSSPFGLSILMTQAPRSPSIMPACGPASARVISRTTVPSNGPEPSSGPEPFDEPGAPASSSYDTFS